MMNKLWHNRWICNIPINSCCRDNSHGFTFWNFKLEDFHSFQLTFPIFCERTTKKIYQTKNGITQLHPITLYRFSNNIFD